MAEYEPFIVERAEGCELIDVDGHRYIDGVSSMWCNVHGHGQPRINAAIAEQLGQVAHVTSLGASQCTSIRFARRLVEVAPGPQLQHVYFSSDGSSAVEVALKMAFQYWRQRPAGPRPEKSAFVALERAYHGDTLGSVSVGGVARFHEMFRPLLFEVLRTPSPDTYRRPAGVSREEAGVYYLRQLEDILAREHSRVAALVVEPLIQCAAGMVTHPAGYLRGVRELATRYETLLIVDEVATGFGRTGSLFACQQEGVEPDLLCLGKGITGGYLPLAATLASDEIWGAFLGDYTESRHFFHGHTFGGNPLGAAAGLASLELFDELNVLESLRPKIERLGRWLAEIAQHPQVGDTRQVGLLGAVDLVSDAQLKLPYPWEEKRGLRVCEVARQHGVFLRPLGSVLVIMPPLSVTLEQLDTIGRAVIAGIAEAC